MSIRPGRHQIVIKQTTYNQLIKYAQYGMSMDTTILRLIDEHTRLTQTIKEMRKKK